MEPQRGEMHRYLEQHPKQFSVFPKATDPPKEPTLTFMPHLVEDDRDPYEGLPPLDDCGFHVSVLEDVQIAFEVIDRVPLRVGRRHENPLLHERFDNDVRYGLTNFYDLDSLRLRVRTTPPE